MRKGPIGQIVELDREGGRSRAWSIVPSRAPEELRKYFPRRVDPRDQQTSSLPDRDKGDWRAGQARALLAASPVYYQAPLYRRLELDSRVDFTALFALTVGVEPADLGYGRPVVHEQNVLNGYRSEFLRHASNKQDIGSRWGLRDPDIVRALLKGQYEVLWSHGYNHAVHVLAAATMRLRGIPIMFREERTLLHPRGVVKAAAKEIALRMLFKGSYGLYIGSESRDGSSITGCPGDPLFAAPYCVTCAYVMRMLSSLPIA